MNEKMTNERRLEIDKKVAWAILRLSQEDFEDWYNQNVCPEEYITGREGFLLDWCELCEYENRVDSCDKYDYYCSRYKDKENEDSDINK